MALPKTSLKQVQDAWIKRLADFRAWVKPETEHAYAWKMRQFSQAIAGAKSTIIDDAESILTEWRKNQNADVEKGTSTFIPVMITAIAPIQMPPDMSQVVGVPYWCDAAVGDTKVQFRTIKTAIKAQAVYFSTNPHDAKSISDQFCAYFDDDSKRRFEVDFLIGDTEKMPFKFTIVENLLMPDNIPTEAKNLYIVSIDVIMVGVVPHVIGLGGQWDNVTDNGHNPQNGSMPTGTRHFGDVVVQADSHAKDCNGDALSHWRVTADKDTGESNIEEVP